ncbi:colicin immunity domain-containing protein, partial [Pseudomonas aeruginosa]
SSGSWAARIRCCGDSRITEGLFGDSLSGKSFTKKFFEMWRSEGASGMLKKDDDNLGACLRLMFGMADCFTDGPKDNDGEINEEELKQEVRELLKKYKYI